MKLNKEQIDKMTLREVMEYTKGIPIKDGALCIVFEKIVWEIERLEIIVNCRVERCDDI